MKRSFKFVSVASATTPQPVFGTTLTAACGPVGTPEKSLQSIEVADSSWFQQSDYALIDPANSTVAKRERLLVESVPDSTHIKVQGMQYAHASGVYVQLAVVCQSVLIQAKVANTAAITIGTDPAMVVSTGVKCIYFLAQSASGQPGSFLDTNSGGADQMKTDEYWFDGTHTGDEILPSFTAA